MKQPKALFLLASVQMWECFSFYGMRALLVLFMIDELCLPPAQAFAIYGVYTAAVEMGVLAGGFAADRLFGLRRSVIIGGCIIAAGHIVLATFGQKGGLFSALALIAAGSCLFKTNLKALLGLFYEPEDGRRESAFTLLYTGMNIGGFLAAVSCGFAAKCWGWHIGFALAAAGMLLSLFFLGIKLPSLEGKGSIATAPSRKMVFGASIVAPLLIVFIAAAIAFPTFSAPLLPLLAIAALGIVFRQSKMRTVEEKKNIKTIVAMVFFLSIYFCAEEWMGSLVLQFSDRHTTGLFFHFSVPSSVLLSFNPLTIMVLGPLVAKISLKNPWKKLAIAFVLQGVAYAFLSAASMSENPVSTSVVALSFACIALGELFIAPVIYAECTKRAPVEMRGLLMSLVTMGFAYGSLFSGSAAAFFHPEGQGQFASFFFWVAAGCAFCALMCLKNPLYDRRKFLSRSI